MAAIQNNVQRLTHLDILTKYEYLSGFMILILMNMFYNIVIDVDYYLSLVYQLTIGTHLRRGTHDHVHVSWVQFMTVVDQT